MDDGSPYSGYNGCIVGGTRPTNVDVVAGTRSTVDRAGTRAIRSIVDMPGTSATTVDCGGTFPEIQHDEILNHLHSLEPMSFIAHNNR